MDYLKIYEKFEDVKEVADYINKDTCYLTSGIL